MPPTLLDFGLVDRLLMIVKVFGRIGRSHRSSDDLLKWNCIQKSSTHALMVDLRPLWDDKFVQHMCMLRTELLKNALFYFASTSPAQSASRSPFKASGTVFRMCY